LHLYGSFVNDDSEQANMRKPIKFEGIYTLIITLHTVDGTIDKDAFNEVVEFLISSGVHCILVGGSTGEYYAKTNEERIELMNFASEFFNQRTLIMVGTGATRTRDSLMFALEAKKAVADFLLVNSPPYSVLTNAVWTISRWSFSLGKRDAGFA
jgi:4-hydroxy-tetrahydrodipicolinate synthase